MNFEKSKFLSYYQNLGFKSDDIVYVGSSLLKHIRQRDLHKVIMDSLIEYFHNGTIVMPAFNFNFPENNFFSVSQTVSQSGILSEYFRKEYSEFRTFNTPTHSVCIFGKELNNFKKLNSITPFGENSVFQLLKNLNSKVLLFDCSLHQGAPHYHWLEEINNVPYRYWKKFTGNVENENKAFEVVFFMYVRKDNIKVNADIIENKLLKNKKFHSLNYNGMKISMFDVNDLYTSFNNEIKKNPYILVENQGQLIGVDHIGICSKYNDKIEAFFKKHFNLQDGPNGNIESIDGKVKYFGGLNVDLEFVYPNSSISKVYNHSETFYNSPIHHIALEVKSLDETILYFKKNGISIIDNKIFKSPKENHRVAFLSPHKTGGILVELVSNN